MSAAAGACTGASAAVEAPSLEGPKPPTAPAELSQVDTISTSAAAPKKKATPKKSAKRGAKNTGSAGVTKDGHQTQLPTQTKGAPSTQLPAVLKEIEASYVKKSTLSADFSQTVETTGVAESKRSTTSTGKIIIKRPNKLRWETLQPDKNLMVSNGKTIWIYTPPFDEGERGQVIVRKSSEVQSRLANLLLSGSFSQAKGIKIHQVNADTFALTPAPGSSGTVNEAEIQIDAEQKLIRKVTLHHSDGNQAAITLSNIKLGEPAGNEVFDFVIPPETDKLEN